MVDLTRSAGHGDPRAILGIWDGHDAGVALVVDGELRFAQCEERFTRTRRASGFPFHALSAGLRHCGLEPRDLDLVAVPGRFGRLAHRLGDPLYRAGEPDRDPLSPASRLVRSVEIGVARLPGLRDLEAAGSRGVLLARLLRLGVRAPIRLVPHHDAHAWTARLVGGPGAMLVTLDGYGDGLAGTFDALGEGREEVPSPRCSPALVYGAVTRVLGFGEGDEGKVMGLAASGDPRPLREWFRKVIGWQRCDAALGGRRRRLELLQHRREDVAAALQARVEEVVIGWIAARRRGRSALAVAGGLFANVALNGRLASLFDRFDCFPHMGDGGLAVGAAAAACGGFAFDHVFHGPSWTEAEVERAAAECGLPVERRAEPEAALLETIEAGGIAARWVGRSELGPRALGHRSILLRADRPALADDLNERLRRDEFMPFAPIRRRGAGSTTMTVVALADAELRERCPAAVHVDGTVRTQLVEAAVDPGLDGLLARAEERGLPALINTSFNLHGEPIVESPADALRTFRAARLDVLQLGRLVVRRDPVG